MSREAVSATPRKGFTKKQRAEAFLAAEGRCGFCKEKITGPFQIDHIVALDHGGAHEPSNWRVCHAECHLEKTKRDVKASAKIKRIQRKADPETRKPSTLKSGSNWPPKGVRKLQSRGFEKRRK